MMEEPIMKEIQKKEIWKEDKPLEIPIIIYDGPENSGKTTIKRIVNEMLDHRSLSFERWTGTQYAYGRLFERDVNLHELVNLDYRLNSCFRVYLVFLYARPDIILSRLNTDPISDLKYKLTETQICELISFFEEWYDATAFSAKMRFNTSETPPSIIAECIVSEVSRK